MANTEQAFKNRPGFFQTYCFKTATSNLQFEVPERLINLRNLFEVLLPADNSYNSVLIDFYFTMNLILNHLVSRLSDSDSKHELN